MPAPFGLPAELAELQDDYDVLSELGRGGAAVVYRARDRALGREVAVKVVHPRPTSPDDDPVARLAREARLVAQLQHPHIVAVYAVRRLRGGGLALIMQLVAGGTLKTALHADGPLAPDRAERVLRDVATALAYAHARGLVHRDVKPENIFLDGHTGAALLADFGIARSTDADSATMTGTAVGTPFYMSPEQVDGGVVDGRSDLYSLGLVAWEALTGRRPWDGESLYSVIHKQKFEELPPVEALRPGVPRRLQYVVERMLQKRPGARWAGADGLLAQLAHPILPADYARWQQALPGRVERFRAAETERAAERAAEAMVEPLASASTLHFAPGTVATAGEGQIVLAPTPPSRGGASRPWVPGPAADIAAGGVTRPASARGADPALPPPGTTVDLHAADAASPVEPLSIGGAAVYADTVEPSWERLTHPAAARVRARPWRAVVAFATAGVLAAGGMLTADRFAVLSIGRVVGTASSMALTGWSGVSQPARHAHGTRLQDPTISASSAARAPSGASPAALIAAGGRHSCAVTLAGRAHCWGANERGQLGDGSPPAARSNTPVAVAGTLSFTALAGGLAHTCALTRLGDVYCWGANTYGQLGDATTVRRNAPVRVAGPAAYASVAAGSAHTCAVTTEAAVRCWGANDQGQLGDGLREGRGVPTVVRIDGAVARVAAGGQHTCAVTNVGRLYCWGANNAGQLGIGRTGGSVITPRPVPIPGRVTVIGIGLSHTCAATDDGALWCWGRNEAGQLGDGTRTSRAAPTRARLGADRVITALAVGASQTCALEANGVLSCWGRNARGPRDEHAPTEASRPVPNVVRLPTPVVTAAAGSGHTCAITVASTTLCWGDGTDGQLGDASVKSRLLPVAVRFPSGVTAQTGPTTPTSR